MVAIYSQIQEFNALLTLRLVLSHYTDQATTFRSGARILIKLRKRPGNGFSARTEGDNEGFEETVSESGYTERNDGFQPLDCAFIGRIVAANQFAAGPILFDQSAAKEHQFRVIEKQKRAFQKRKRNGQVGSLEEGSSAKEVEPGTNHQTAQKLCGVERAEAHGASTH